MLMKQQLISAPLLAFSIPETTLNAHRRTGNLLFLLH